MSRSGGRTVASAVGDSPRLSDRNIEATGLRPPDAASAMVSAACSYLDQRLADVGEHLDWNDPTVAFYGETNAGKSTLIEALRLLFRCPVEDTGRSIGDGTPDFTREAACHRCEHDGMRFNLLDVPGVEGDESKVAMEVENAVQRAHAVFFVTADARPPQGGDAGGPGTLEKIGRQLRPQAKVWAVYNKKLQSPRQVGASLTNAGETGSLAVGPDSLDGKMREALGDQYQGHVALSALPAFLALAADLPPDDRFATKRRKFVTEIGAVELLRFSGLEAFGRLLARAVPSPDEIVRANLRKLALPVGEVADELERLGGAEFATPASALAGRLTALAPELEMIADDASRAVNRLTDELTDGAVKSVKERMLAAVEKGVVGDDGFKAELEKVIGEVSARLPDTVDKRVKATVQRTHASRDEALFLVKKHLRDTDAFRSSSFAVSFSHAVNVATHSGVQWGNLVGAVVGGVMAIASSGGVLAVAAVVTALFSGFRSVKNWFSKDYRKSQLKASLNAELDAIKIKLRADVTAHLAEIDGYLRRHVIDVMKPLRAVEQELRDADRSVGNAVLDLRRSASDDDFLRRRAGAASGTGQAVDPHPSRSFDRSVSFARV